MKAAEFERLVSDARDKASITGPLCEEAMRRALDEIEVTHPRSRSAILAAMNFVAWTLAKTPSAFDIRAAYETMSESKKYRKPEKERDDSQLNQLDLFEGA